MPVISLDNVVRVACGYNHSLCIRCDGALFTFGEVLHITHSTHLIRYLVDRVVAVNLAMAIERMSCSLLSSNLLRTMVPESFM